MNQKYGSLLQYPAQLIISMYSIITHTVQWFSISPAFGQKFSSTSHLTSSLIHVSRQNLFGDESKNKTPGQAFSSNCNQLCLE